MHKSDKSSIIWLLILYTLQGVPLGMSAVFPLLLKERGASYADLALFSISAWPFALKLLWAPIVDGTNFPGVGRRKSWLVPSQLLIGILMYYLSLRYENLLSSGDSGIQEFTGIFFALYFLAATQDIAVDGWALTMLSKDNVGYAGTCNSVGQTAGYFLAFSGFFGLSKLGLCSLTSFMQVWAVLFVVITVLVALIKSEKNDVDGAENETVFGIYKEMLSVLRLDAVKDLTFILLSCGIPFIHGLIGVKFQDAGVSSEIIALLATLSTPVHIIMPWIVARYLPKMTPMSSFRAIFPIRLVFQIASVCLVLLTPTGISGPWIGTVIFYGICLVLSMLESAAMQVMFTSKMTFFAKVSDPVIGGTFMTVLNTISNIGGNIAGQFSYRLAQWGTVPDVVDGFYVVVVCATIYGFVWIKYFGPRLTALEKRDEDDWRVSRHERKAA
jgi:PAT family acetyl-CoA transporter-like MFS transporter 1